MIFDCFHVGTQPVKTIVFIRKLTYCCVCPSKHHKVVNLMLSSLLPHSCLLTLMFATRTMLLSFPLHALLRVRLPFFKWHYHVLLGTFVVFLNF